MQKGEKVDFLFAIYRYFPYGGLQKDFLRMAHAALEKGHSVRILAASWEGEKVPGMEIELLKVSGLTNHGKMASFLKQGMLPGINDVFESIAVMILLLLYS